MIFSLQIDEAGAASGIEPSPYEEEEMLEQIRDMQKEKYDLIIFQLFFESSQICL